MKGAVGEAPGRSEGGRAAELWGLIHSKPGLSPLEIATAS